MTMLDDERLASLFGRAGAAFEVPATGVDDIMARAAGRVAGADPDGAGTAADPEAPGGGTEEHLPSPSAPDGDGRMRRVVVVARRHRVLAAAACIMVALVLSGTVGVLVRSPSGPTVTSGLAHLPHSQATPPPGATTTIPGSTGAGSALKGEAPGAFGIHGAQGSASSPVTTPTAPSLPSGAVGQPAKIEQTGTLGLEVGRGRLARTMTQLTALAGAYGGFVANSQTQTGTGAAGAPYGSVTLQVPVDSFSTVVRQAQSLGKTSALSTKATDVTGQYVDLQSRITALEDSRQQYLTILAKATTVGDVLAVQEQLDGIQTQIEQLQGQLQVLSSETSYSTLTVTVNESTPPPPPGPLPESGLVRAWHDSIGGFVAGVEGVVRLAGPVLFALLCLGVLLVGGRALWRRFQRHRL